MYKITRDLIKIRKPHNEFIEHVNVKQIGGGEPKRCYENACKLNDENPKLKIVSGWFVNKWDTEKKSCYIIAHYWNLDENDNFIDISIEPETEGEYVADGEIGIFAQNNYDALLSSVCSSIFVQDNKFIGVDFREHGKIFREFKDFSTKSLFAELN
jgi:hypothetical protein